MAGDPQGIPRGPLEALDLVISATTDSTTGSATAETAVAAAPKEATAEVHFTNNNNIKHNKTTITK
jgi:hypothetical protein